MGSVLSGFHFGSSSPGPCITPASGGAAATSLHPHSPFLLRIRALIPQRWARPADGSQPSPSLGTVLEESGFAQGHTPYLPRSAHTSDWPHCLHWGQFCAATPTPELTQEAGWPFVVTGISRGPEKLLSALSCSVPSLTPRAFPTKLPTLQCLCDSRACSLETWPKIGGLETGLPPAEDWATVRTHRSRPHSMGRPQTLPVGQRWQVLKQKCEKKSKQEVTES